MKPVDYWAETIADAAIECGAELSLDQIKCIAEAIIVSHENYGMAFYEPPASERLNQIERDFKNLLEESEKAHEAYKSDAESAIRKSLNISRFYPISIGKNGDVFRHDGRTTQVQ